MGMYKISYVTRQFRPAVNPSARGKSVLTRTYNVRAYRFGLQSLVQLAAIIIKKRPLKSIPEIPYIRNLLYFKSLKRLRNRDLRKAIKNPQDLLKSKCLNSFRL